MNNKNNKNNMKIMVKSLNQTIKISCQMQQYQQTLLECNNLTVFKIKQLIKKSNLKI